MICWKKKSKVDVIMDLPINHWCGARQACDEVSPYSLELLSREEPFAKETLNWFMEKCRLMTVILHKMMFGFLKYFVAIKSTWNMIKFLKFLLQIIMQCYEYDVFMCWIKRKFVVFISPKRSILAQFCLFLLFSPKVDSWCRTLCCDLELN